MKKKEKIAEILKKIEEQKENIIAVANGWRKADWNGYSGIDISTFEIFGGSWADCIPNAPQFLDKNMLYLCGVDKFADDDILPNINLEEIEAFLNLNY